MGNVVLLRDPSEILPDRYEAAFAAAGYHSVSVPVLDTVYTNIQDLGNIILQGPEAHNLSGVLLTSKRSCDAWRKALEMLDNGKDRPIVASWECVPFYVVGNATATALKEAFSTFKQLGLGSPDVRGQSSGSAANLGPLILEDLKWRPAKLFYLTGDKNRDTLPRILEDGGIEIQSLQVYETRGSPSFPQALSLGLLSLPESNTWWIVYFAPSAAAFVTPILREHFHIEGLQYSSRLTPARVAAIGPTTDIFLREELHVHVHAMAQKPTPDEIVSVITDFDRES